MEKLGLTLETVQEVLNVSFSKDSAGVEELWTPENPAYSQCGAATRLVQDLFGGKIYQFQLSPKWQDRMGYRGHFINKVPRQGLVDTTKSQFPEDFPYKELLNGSMGKIVTKDRRKVLEDDCFAVGRYYRLRKRFIPLIVQRYPQFVSNPNMQEKFFELKTELLQVV